MAGILWTTFFLQFTWIFQVEIGVCWQWLAKSQGMESLCDVVFAYHSSLICAFPPGSPLQSPAILFAFLSTCIPPMSARLCKCCSCSSGWTALLPPTLISSVQEPILFPDLCPLSNLLDTIFRFLYVAYYSPSQKEMYLSVFWPFFIRMRDLFKGNSSFKRCFYISTP